MVRSAITHSLSINIAEENIKDFMAFYRKEFSWATILPKMHILEDHSIPWLRRFHVGAGLMGEQGAESVHALMKGLNRTYQNIPNDTTRFKHTITEHSIATHPSLLALRPPPKKRKIEDQDQDLED